jgi:hypothetical protein
MELAIHNGMLDVDFELGGLPEGYGYVGKTAFPEPESSHGCDGIALAVLLLAVKDGCNGEWLEEIAAFYEIAVPEGMLRRVPGRVEVRNKTGELFNPLLHRWKRKIGKNQLALMLGVRIPRIIAVPQAELDAFYSILRTYAHENAFNRPRNEDRLRLLGE